MNYSIVTDDVKFLVLSVSPAFFFLLLFFITVLCNSNNIYIIIYYILCSDRCCRKTKKIIKALSFIDINRSKFVNTKYAKTTCVLFIVREKLL